MTDESIRALLAAKADALIRRAADDLAALIHPHFVYVNASGTTFGKAAYIDLYCASGRIIFREQRFSDLDVRAFPGFAVATALVHDRFSAGETDVAGAYRTLCVFSHIDNRWLWAAGQTMPAT